MKTMDPLTLCILVFTFFAAMTLYFASHYSQAPKGNIKQSLRNVKRQSVPDVPLYSTMPDILRYNLAVQNMLQREA